MPYFMLSLCKESAAACEKSFNGGWMSIFYLNLTSWCPPSSGNTQRDATAWGGQQGWRSPGMGWLGGQQRALPSTQQLTFAGATV